MGCTLSVIPKSPKAGGEGGSVEKEKKPTLVEKWINFREWVRRNHGKKTKVVPISIKSPETTYVEAANLNAQDPAKNATTAVDKTHGTDTISRRQFSQSEINVAQWLIEHETTMDTRSYSPLPGTTRPKAAKGQRTILPLLEEHVCLPGAVVTDDDLFAGCEAYLFKNGVTTEIDGPDMDKRTKRRTKDRKTSRKSQSKGANGNHAERFQPDHENTQIKGSPQDCLDAWRMRKLPQE